MRGHSFSFFYYYFYTNPTIKSIREYYQSILSLKITKMSVVVFFIMLKRGHRKMWCGTMRWKKVGENREEIKCKNAKKEKDHALYENKRPLNGGRVLMDVVISVLLYLITTKHDTC